MNWNNGLKRPSKLHLQRELKRWAKTALLRAIIKNETVQEQPAQRQIAPESVAESEILIFH